MCSAGPSTTVGMAQTAVPYRPMRHSRGRTRPRPRHSCTGVTDGPPPSSLPRGAREAFWTFSGDAQPVQSGQAAARQAACHHATTAQCGTAHRRQPRPPQGTSGLSDAGPENPVAGYRLRPGSYPGRRYETAVGVGCGAHVFLVPRHAARAPHLASPWLCIFAPLDCGVITRALRDPDAELRRPRQPALSGPRRRSAWPHWRCGASRCLARHHDRGG